MFNYNFGVGGWPGDTFRIAATDDPQQFSAAQRDGNPIACLITCETNDLRFTFNEATPTPTAAGLGHILYVGQSIRLMHPDLIRTFNFINHTQQDAGAIQVTMEYEDIQR